MIIRLLCLGPPQALPQVRMKIINVQRAPTGTSNPATYFLTAMEILRTSVLQETIVATVANLLLPATALAEHDAVPLANFLTSSCIGLESIRYCRHNTTNDFILLHNPRK